MLICPSDIFNVAGTSLHFKMLFSTQPINLVAEEISQNKSFVQTPVTYFINQKEKHVPSRHNSILTWMKSGAPFFRIDIIYIIYLDVKYLSEVFLSIYYEKPTAKTTLKMMRHFFAKKLHFSPTHITWDSTALKWQCFKHTLS